LDGFLQFRTLSKDELAPGIDSAIKFTSVCINTALYLPWLISKCLENKVIFKRAVFGHISEVSNLEPSREVDLVVSCTGLMAPKLGGVEDQAVVPARGQIVVVRNEDGKMINLSGTDDGDDEACYIMARAAGGGTVIGGFYQKGNWESQPDSNLATRIKFGKIGYMRNQNGGI